MILTCPACDTKYVVKDGAIPLGGRQVRCAACKHSWHQDPEIDVAEPATAADVNFGGPPLPSTGLSEDAVAEFPEQAVEEGGTAAEPQPGSDEPETSPWGAVATESASAIPTTDEPTPDEVAMEEAPALADEWRPTDEGPATAPEEEFSSYAPIADDEDATGRRWPLMLGLLVLIAVAAAAFWFFAPPEWKARAGLAQAGSTPLQLMITTRERQTLQSGNELILISGRVINPTNREQQVPPIQAELRDQQTQKVVHRWTIAPPARVLAPGSSASFNSAEVDVPEGGELLTITLGA
jgi:predicted Zn finger-like uncharacterized protein